MVIRNPPRFLKALSLAALLATGVLAASCSLEEPVADSASLAEKPDATFIGFSREEVENGIVTFAATAERAEYFQEKGLLVIYDVVFEDRGSGGDSPKSTGRADKAVYHEDTGDAEFSGFVQLNSLEEDASFETSSLSYHSATQTIEGAPDDPVIVKVGRKLFMQGMGFFADIQSKAFAFRNGVQGFARAESSPEPAKGEER